MPVNNAMIQVKLITVHGLEVYQVVCNGTVLNSYMYEGLATTKANAYMSYLASMSKK